MRKNKLVMWGTLGFLALVLAIVIYSYLRGGVSSTPAPASASATIQQPSNSDLPPSQWSVRN